MSLRILPWLALCLVWGCGAHEHEGSDSGATCQQQSELDYESFGRAFMEKYCAQCHSSSAAANARNGAPSDHDFDTLAAIHDTSMEHIDHVAAAGPNATNTEMPPADYPQPTQQEREDLGRWLACGAP